MFHTCDRHMLFTLGVVVLLVTPFWFDGRQSVSACFTSCGEQLVAPAQHCRPAIPDRLSNQSVSWEIMPSYEVVVLLDEPARRLVKSTDRQAAVDECLKMLKNEDQVVVGHVILCHIFKRAFPFITSCTLGERLMFMQRASLAIA